MGKKYEKVTLSTLAFQVSECIRCFKMSDLKSVIDQIDRLSLIAGAELHRLNGSVFSEKKKKGAPISN